MAFKKGNKPVPHKEGCNCFRCSKIPWNKGKKGVQKMSKETRKKMVGRKLTEEHRRKLRMAAINYLNKYCGGIMPMIGRNEKQLLDEFQEEYGYNVQRQYPVEGYFLDGYVKELNLAIEVDEKPKDKERDKIRQKIIEKKLRCKFLRIKDYNNHKEVK